MSKPVLVQFASADFPRCCQFDTSHDPAKPGPFVNGIRVTPQFSYRGSPGAPVTNVVVNCANVGRHVWTLTAQERQQSETGSVTYEFEVCLPCGTLAPDRVAHFELIAHDKNFGTSHNDFGIYVGEDQFVQCCGNMPKRPVRPIPKGG